MAIRRVITVFGIIAILALLSGFIHYGDNETDDSKIKTELTDQSSLSDPDAKNQGNQLDARKGIQRFFSYTGFANATWGHIIMIVIGLFFIFLAIRFDYEPLLLIPIGVGILIGNIPFMLNAGYYGVRYGIYPPLIFLGIGAMTDFSSLISNPRLMLLGAAAQVGIFITFLGALILGFHPAEAGAIGIIGGADGPTAIFLSSKLANGLNIIGQTVTGDPIYVKNLIGPIAIAAYVSPGHTTAHHEITDQ
jgi:oxaloacetate decarboxylase beta subunit